MHWGISTNFALMFIAFMEMMEKLSRTFYEIDFGKIRKNISPRVDRLSFPMFTIPLPYCS